MPHGYISVRGARDCGCRLKTPINIMKCYNIIIPHDEAAAASPAPKTSHHPQLLRLPASPRGRFQRGAIITDPLPAHQGASPTTQFVHLSSKIEIQHNISSFNLIDYEKEDSRVKQDQHIVAAKLKRIENNAELKRANMVRMGV